MKIDNIIKYLIILILVLGIIHLFIAILPFLTTLLITGFMILCLYIIYELYVNNKSISQVNNILLKKINKTFRK